MLMTTHHDDDAMFHEVLSLLVDPPRLKKAPKRFRITPFRKIQSVQYDIRFLTAKLHCLREAQRRRLAEAKSLELKREITKCSHVIGLHVAHIQREWPDHPIPHAPQSLGHIQAPHHGHIHAYMHKKLLILDSVYSTHNPTIAPEIVDTEYGVELAYGQEALVSVSAATYAKLYWHMFTSSLPLKLEAMTIELVEEIDDNTVCIRQCEDTSTQLIVKRFYISPVKTVFITATDPRNMDTTTDVTWLTVESVSDSVARVASRVHVCVDTTIKVEQEITNSHGVKFMEAILASKAKLERHVERMLHATGHPMTQIEYI
ncbi:Aste57867_9873 [Aphanomyces stellatus]|uniref:Aste57867_9873 protein n=1 Tax=Aphanomyces stellatus TaxID=120398 RepID=A0A485KNZ1_9STRA|nr:hypothetical protein As57867_009834 [Aphanomyces stellatus]VFT86752.1 Aste57867_9873 [Aphanomyces stellatus]